MEIDGAAIVVTGGASGLGAGAAEYLCASGARVAAFDVNPISDKLVELGVAAHVCDVSDETSVSDCIASAARNLGTIHAVVNCAGIVKPCPLFGPDGRYPAELFRKILDVNLVGTFLVMSYATEVMARNEPNADGERGVFVNIASIAAFDRSSSIGYAASKGGVVALSLTAAHELSGYGIRTNAIAPGFMDTPMFGGLPEEYVQRLLATMAFPKRLARMNEFGHLVKNLIENPYINGTSVRFDAGARV